MDLTCSNAAPKSRWRRCCCCFAAAATTDAAAAAASCMLLHMLHMHCCVSCYFAYLRHIWPACCPLHVLVELPKPASQVLCCCMQHMVCCPCMAGVLDAMHASCCMLPCPVLLHCISACMCACMREHPPNPCEPPAKFLQAPVKNEYVGACMSTHTTKSTLKCPVSSSAHSGSASRGLALTSASCC